MNRYSFLLLLLPVVALSQRGYTWNSKDTLRFTGDSSYSRAILKQGKNLYFGTSRSGVIRLNEKNGKCETLLPPTAAGEFRSIEMVGKKVFGITSGDTGSIYCYDNGPGILYNEPHLFLDDMIRKGTELILLGDPVKHRFFLAKLRGTDYKFDLIAGPQSFPNEACYAASATTVVFNGEELQFISGGADAVRIHRSEPPYNNWVSTDLPMTKAEGAGPFSIHYIDGKRGMIVGGNYLLPKDTLACGLYTEDGGNSWHPSRNQPRGYRSCVTGNPEVQFCCGSTGIDFSVDGGKNWRTFDNGNFCTLLLVGKKLYATTGKGYCVRYELSSYVVKD